MWDFSHEKQKVCKESMACDFRDEDVKDVKSLRYSVSSALSAVDKDGKVLEEPDRFIREEETSRANL